MLTFVGDAQTVEGTELFTPELLARLATLVPCENISFEEANVAERVLLSKAYSFGAVAIPVPRTRSSRCPTKPGLSWMPLRSADIDGGPAISGW
jgi:hypothetical protein